MAEELMRCAMTGAPIRDSGDGIWGDGESISWEYINRQIAIQEGKLGPEDGKHLIQLQPKGDEILEMVEKAIIDEVQGCVPSPLWGRIGELYIAERFSVALSRAHAQGHDGHLGNELVEIKTITPNKQRSFVRVKKGGNFSVLAVVRVGEGYELDARLVRREKLNLSGEGEHMTIAWSTVCRIAERPRQKYALEKMPELEELGKYTLKPEIQTLHARIKAKGLNRKARD